MDVKLEKPLANVGMSTAHPAMRNAERQIIIYWVVSTLVGVPLLYDWLFAWNVPATFSQPWLVIYLIFSLALSQTLYVLVARHGGRSINLKALTIFAVGNGIAETFAFAAIYRVGALLGSAVVGSFAPSAASFAGFILGLIFFMIYGGLIHGLFWMRVLPPHFDDDPRSQGIRKYRPLAEVVLVLGWGLCFWLFEDIWTVILFHTIVDIGLMLLVRPAIFGAKPKA